MALLPSSTFHAFATKKAAKEKAEKTKHSFNTTQEMRRQRACCPSKEVVDRTTQQAQTQALEEEDDYMSAAFIVDVAPPATSAHAPKRKRGTSIFISYLFNIWLEYYQPGIQAISGTIPATGHRSGTRTTLTTKQRQQRKRRGSLNMAQSRLRLHLLSVGCLYRR